MRKRVRGRDERIMLGRYPEMTIEQARKAGLTNAAIVMQGLDPNEEKRKLRNDMTFGELFAQFMERYSRKQKKSWRHDEREVKKYLSHWFKRRLHSITRQEVQTFHEHIHDNHGLYQANRILERIRAMYNKAIEWGWEGRNPTQGIKKYKEKSRERFLRSDELPRFFAALEQEENPIARDFILLALYTGARKSNVLSMRWEEINFTAAAWHIPETKNGMPHIVPLSPQALAILMRRRQERINDFVLPGAGKSGHMVEPKKAWNRILQSAGIKDLRIHDLRRTLGSWMAANGATTAIIGKTLAHKSLHATKVYERLNQDPVRAYMNAAHEAMIAAARNA